MPITPADIPALLAARVYGDLRREQVWREITSEDFTQACWVAGGAREVEIPRPVYTYTAGSTAGTAQSANDSEGIRVVTRNRGDSWAALSGIDQTKVAFATSGRYASSQFVGYEDAIEAPWPVVETYRSRSVYEMADDIGQAIMDAIRGYPNNTTNLGSTSAYIEADGEPNGNAGQVLVHDAIQQWARLCEERNLNAEASQDVGAKYAIMHPRLFGNLDRLLPPSATELGRIDGKHLARQFAARCSRLSRAAVRH